MGRVALKGMRRHSDADNLWLITFADLMVQLMAVFALLYALSSADQKQMQQVLESMRKALGVQGPQNGPLKGEGILPGSAGIQDQSAADLERLLSDLKSSAGEDAGTRLRIVSFRGSLLFDEGSAQLTSGSQVLLDRIADLTAQYSGFTLICEGHAAPKERGRNGGDALDLSGQRGQSAVRYLVGKGINSTAIGAEARGDYLPDGDSGSPEGRALQRRVVFRFQRVAER